MEKIVIAGDTDDKDKPSARLLFSSRLAIAVIGFVGFVNCYALRINMSVAMVCMVNQTALDLMNNVTRDGEASNQTDGEFAWPKSVQGIILGSFFWGYIFTLIPGGLLSHFFGGKKVLGWSMFICAVVSLAIPIGARLHYGMLLALRFLIGLSQGTVWPAMHSILSRWMPPFERSRLTGFTLAGSQIGNVIALSASGALCTYGFAGGWPSIFYVFGGVTILWFIAWMIVVYDSPQQHPRVSIRERKYIEMALGGAVSKKPPDIPWKAILTSRAVYAITVVHTCSHWFIYTFLTCIPTYLSDVFHLKATDNGVISALPYIGLGLAMVVSASIADRLVQKKIVTLTVCRKIFNGIGTFGPAVFIVILSHIPPSQPAPAIIIMVIAISLSGIPYGSGYMVNPADIAPNYSAVVFSISNTFATIPGFVAPIVAGYITSTQSPAEWRIVFYICAAIFVLGGSVYIAIGTGELQKWAIKKENLTAIDLDAVGNGEHAGLIVDDQVKDSTALCEAQKC